jgi:hypothetical protein
MNTSCLWQYSTGIGIFEVIRRHEFTFTKATYQEMRKCFISGIRNNERMVLIKEVIFCEPIKEVNNVHYPLQCSF